MKTRKNIIINLIVYLIGIFWIITIFVNILIINTTKESVFSGLKDLFEVAITLFIYWAIDQLRNPKNINKASEKALKQIHNEFNIITRIGISKRAKNSNTEQYLLFIKNDDVPFIPLSQLKQGILELHISYKTLKNFDYMISPIDAEKNSKIIEVRKNVFETLSNYLKNNFGESYYKMNPLDEKVKVTFSNDKIDPDSYQNIIFTCGKLAIETLQKNNKN